MPRFRATVWTLSAMAEAVDGNAAIRRFIVEQAAESEYEFMARVADAHTRHVDDNVWFGPVTRK